MESRSLPAALRPPILAAANIVHEPTPLYLQSVVDLDTKLPDGTFEFRVPEEELNGARVRGAAVYQRGFSAPH